MTTNYRLEYYDKDNKKQDVLIVSRSIAEAKFRLAVESGCSSVVLSKRVWKPIAKF